MPIFRSVAPKKTLNREFSLGTRNFIIPKVDTSVLSQLWLLGHICMCVCLVLFVVWDKVNLIIFMSNLQVESICLLLELSGTEIGVTFLVNHDHGKATNGRTTVAAAKLLEWFFFQISRDFYPKQPYKLWILSIWILLILNGITKFFRFCLFDLLDKLCFYKCPLSK